MPRQRDVPAWLLLTAILFAAFGHAHAVHAEARISGALDAVRVEASDASIDEVMAALAASFDLRYRRPASLNRRITGIYQGSLQQVIARLLDGHNFIVKTGSDGVEVWVYGAVNSEMVLSPRPAELAPPAAAKARRDERRKRHAL